MIFLVNAAPFDIYSVIMTSLSAVRTAPIEMTTKLVPGPVRSLLARWLQPHSLLCKSLHARCTLPALLIHHYYSLEVQVTVIHPVWGGGAGLITLCKNLSPARDCPLFISGLD